METTENLNEIGNEIIYNMTIFKNKLENNLYLSKEEIIKELENNIILMENFTKNVIYNR